MKKGVKKVNPHEKGTASYWMWEMQFSFALNGSNLGTPLHQANLLCKKAGVSQPDKDALTMRRSLASKAVSINCENVGSADDSHVKSTWDELVAEGATTTVKLRKALLRRDAKKAWECADRESTVGAILDVVTPLLTRLLFWNHSGPPDETADMCPILEQTLCHLGASDKASANLFMDLTWKSKFYDLFGLDGDRDDAIAGVAGALTELLNEVPDDCDLGDRCAETLIESKTACRVIDLLRGDAIQNSLDKELLDTILSMSTRTDNATTASTPLACLWYAIKRSTLWSGRFERWEKWAKKLTAVIGDFHRVRIKLSKLDAGGDLATVSSFLIEVAEKNNDLGVNCVYELHHRTAIHASG